MQEFLNIPFIAISGKYGLTIKAASISFEMSDNCYATAQVSFEAYYQKNIEKKRGKRIVIALYVDEKSTLQDIADYLNDLGYVSRKGKRFHPSQIRSIRDNRPVYEGMYKYGDMGYVKGVHDPILEADR